MMMLAPLALVMFMQTKDDKMAACEEPSRADIIRGNYENKIRFFSPPEKTYEIFASEKVDDELRMSYKDFLRAMTPFCYTPFFEGTSEYVEKHLPSIIKIVDADNDGTISFTEFFFFLVLLQISVKDLKKAFDDFEGGKMHRDKASETLRKIRKQTQSGKKQQNTSARIESRAISASDEEFMKTNKAICARLFKDKEWITKRDILDLQVQFREDLWHFQFHSMEQNDDGKISIEDFLKTSLSSLSGGAIKKYRSRIAEFVKKIGDDDKGVSESEFISFKYFFDELDQVKAKAHRFRYLDFEQFEEIVNEVTKDVKTKRTKQPVKVPQHIARTFFEYMDEDSSGELEPEELMAFNQTSMGQSQDEKAKDETIEKFNKFIASLKKQFTEMTGVAL